MSSVIRTVGQANHAVINLCEQVNNSRITNYGTRKTVLGLISSISFPFALQLLLT